MPAKAATSLKWRMVLGGDATDAHSGNISSQQLLKDIDPFRVTQRGFSCAEFWKIRSTSLSTYASAYFHPYCIELTPTKCITAPSHPP